MVCGVTRVSIVVGMAKSFQVFIHTAQNVLIGAALGFAVGLTIWESLGFLWGGFLGAALGVAYELEQQDQNNDKDEPGD